MLYRLDQFSMAGDPFQPCHSLNPAAASPQSPKFTGGSTPVANFHLRPQPAATTSPSVKKTITRKPKLTCPYHECSDLLFGRPTELRRHTKAFHTDTTAALWCPAYDCPRNKDYGNDPYPAVRKDKIKEHIRKMHQSDVERRWWPVWFADIDKAK
jgi:hypothetical protein